MHRFVRAVSFSLAVFGLTSIGSGSASADNGRAEPAQPSKGLFGSVEFIGGSLAALPQWGRVLDRIRKEEQAYQACDADIRRCRSPALAAWRAKKRSLDGLSERDQLLELNRFINTWPYRLDRENYAVEDFWASPLEFIARSGDCEDYAIIKYVTLRELGFAVERLRIVVVRDVLRNLAHAVLAVKVGNRTLIMDSLFDAVLPHEELSYYVPHYSVNETTRWAHVMPAKSFRRGP